MEKNIINRVKKEIGESIALKRRLLAQPRLLRQVVDLAEGAAQIFRAGGRLLIAGNGGSAADAQHIAGELVGRFMRERAALSALALSTDTSILTALGNDYSFKVVFARQVQAQGRRGDMFLGISTSGNSANVVEALKTARAIGMITACITGQGGGRMAPLCDHRISVPGCCTPRVQESHLMIEHILCGLIEDILFAPQFRVSHGGAGAVSTT